MIAELIINSNVKTLNRTFDYKIPKELNTKVKLGSRVWVKFGNQKALEEGFVINIKETSDFPEEKLKSIIDIDESYNLSEKRIELAKWMSKRYFCNVSDCIKLMLPPGTKTKNIENRIKEKKVNFVRLKKQKDEILFDIDNKKIKTEKQLRAIKFLLEMEYEDINVTDLEVLADVSHAVIKALEKNEYIEIFEKQIDRNPLRYKEYKCEKKLILTEEQQNAFEQIADAMDDCFNTEFLIYGITGSGKTEIYLQLIERAIEQEKTSLVLVPEISLTPQMLDRFVSRYGEENIAVLHSKLSLGERFDEWNRIKTKRVKIVIGARSALFAPISNLGIIIIDEEHDSSYKSEMSPRYDAKEVARKIAKDESIPLVLGSATPEIKTFYRTLQDESVLLKLTKRANKSKLPEVEIVDMKQEGASGNRSIISQRLKEEIQKNIDKKQQTILFLNRRGYSTFVMCRDCGYTVKCKNCNITMTYHMKQDRLKCHYCGYEIKSIKKCPECESEDIRYFGLGTQKLEEEVKNMFPGVSTIRMDVDTVTKKNSHEEILSKFKNDNIDILIGTQMVVKGHHFPNVTLVGVISADGSLNIDDYRATERTFQLLTQVSGRAGREKNEGRVIVQTYNPENYSIEFAKKQDYDLFYNLEIQLRKQLKYPPFCDIIVFGITSDDEASIVKTASMIHQRLKEKIKQKNIPILLYSPVPAPIDKIKNKYRWRIIVKCILDDNLINEYKEILDEMYKTSKKEAQIIVDVNPTNMM